MKIKSVIIYLLFVVPVWAQPEIPVLKNYANDFTNTLTQSQLAGIDNALRTFDDSTSTQIVFLMINTLNGYPIEMYANETAEKNKIGTKENSNGVLFLVVKKDRKMRIEVGYGLEGALPDALASSILRNEVRPYFRRNDYYHGVVAGLNAIILATKGEYRVKKERRNPNSMSPIFWFILITFLIMLLRSRRGGRGGPGGIIFYGGGFGSSGGFSSGGGFGGGFSGGGGSFGGGGASGSW